MQTVRLKFRKIELINFDSRTNSLKLHFFYEENGKMNYVASDCNMLEDVSEFVKDFLSSIRTACKKKNLTKAAYNDDNDILSGHVNVILDEKEDGDTETKLINAIRRLRDNIRGFRSVRTADGYMDKYHKLQGQVIEF